MSSFSTIPGILEKKKEAERILGIDLEPTSAFVREYLDLNPPGASRIKDYDILLESRASEIIRSKPFPVGAGSAIGIGSRHVFEVTHVRFGERASSSSRGSDVERLTPQVCRVNRTNYVLPLTLKGRVIRYDSPEDTVGTVVSVSSEKGCGEFPIMAHSKICVLHGRTPNELALMGEDPYGVRGYFIYNGVERYIQSQEQLTTGKMFIYKTKNGEAEVHMTVKTNINGTMIIAFHGNEFSKENTNEIQMLLTTLRSKTQKKTGNDGLLNVVRIIRLLFEMKKYYAQYDRYHKRYLRLLEKRRTTQEHFETFFNEEYEKLWKLCVEKYKNGDIDKLPPSVDYNQYELFLKETGLTPAEFPYEEPDYTEFLRIYLDEDQYEKCMSLFSSSIYFSELPMRKDPKTKTEYSSRNDLVYLSEIVTSDKVITPYEMYSNVINIVLRDVFSHLSDIPSEEDSDPRENDILRLDRTIHMVVQGVVIYLRYRKGYLKLDDRDSWSIKRAMGAAALIEQLVRSWIYKNSSSIKGLFDKAPEIPDANTILAKFTSISAVMEPSFTTNVWGITGRTKDNITQDVPTSSWQESISAMNIVDVSIPRTKNIPKSIRNVQHSQWNSICPLYTPDGDNTGLPKNTALTALFSSDRDDADIIKYFFNIDSDNYWGKSIITLTQPEVDDTEDDADGKKSPMVFVNGKYLGWVIPEVNVTKLHQELLRLRRDSNSKIFDFDVGIIYDNDRITIETTASRIIFPYFTVNYETQRLIIEELADEGLEDYSFGNLFSLGAIEYLSAGEQEYRRVAVFTSDPEDFRKKKAASKREFRQRKKIFEAEKLKYAADEGSLETMLLLADKIEFIMSRVVEEDLAVLEGITDPKTINKLFKQVKDFTPIEGRTLNNPITIQADEYNNAKNTFMQAERRWNEIKKPHNLYSNCHLDPQTYLSYIANLVFYLANNMSPRTTFTISMIKQASGVFNTNNFNRADDKTKILMFPEQSLVMTEVSARDKFHCVYNNVNMALASLQGNEEDGCIVNRSMLQMGKFRLTKTIVHKVKIKIENNSKSSVSQTLTKPDSTITGSEDASAYEHIGKNGLPYIGAYLKQNHCVIGIVQTVKRGAVEETINISQRMRISEEGIVSKVYLHVDENYINVVVKIIAMHIPEKGDKFTVPNAQKDTIGLVVPSWELPFSENGEVPDVIYNSTCMPSRMTLSFPLMIIGCTLAAILGRRQNATAHRKTVGLDIQYAMKIFAEFGLDPELEYQMYSPQTGNALIGTIFMGLCPFISLKHLSSQKIQARSKGGIKSVLRQPTKGKKQGGGGRIGEMEKDAFIGHGASSLVQQCLMKQSDSYIRVICLSCNNPAITGPKGFSCECGGTKFGKCEIPYSSEVVKHYLSGACISLTNTYETQAQIRNKILRKQQQASDDYSVFEEEVEAEDEEDPYSYLQNTNENEDIVMGED